MRTLADFSAWEARLVALEKQVASLEKQLDAVHNVRRTVIIRVASYLHSADLTGDYCEFGVGNGATFAYAVKFFHANFPAMRYFAFDSFEGMPRPQGHDANLGFSQVHAENKYACSEKNFLHRVKSIAGQKQMEHVYVVPGWFEHTLSQEKRVNTIAVAFVDSIFYESTVHVLQFLTSKIQVGSLIVFDDWFAFRNLPDNGNQRACHEWCKQNGISLSPVFTYSGVGRVFSVRSINREIPQVTSIV